MFPATLDTYKKMCRQLNMILLYDILKIYHLQIEY